FVELGPSTTLISFGRRCLPDKANLWLPSLTPKDPNAAVASLAKLYVAGGPVDWSGFDEPFVRTRVALPTYAFQRQRHWLEPEHAVAGRRTTQLPVGGAPSAGMSFPAASCRTYRIEWSPHTSPSAKPLLHSRWFVLGEGELASGLIGRLRVLGETCTVVPTRPAGPDVLAPNRPDHRYIVDALKADGGSGPARLIYAPVAAGSGVPETALNLLIAAQNVVKAAIDSHRSCLLWFVTPESAGGAASEAGLAYSVLTGFAKVVNVEHPELRCACLHAPAHPQESDFDLIIGAIRKNDIDQEQLAIRDGTLLAPSLIEWQGGKPNTADAEDSFPVRSDRAYLITGGTGGIGLRLALHLARQAPKRLLLVSRRGVIADSDAAIWAEIRATGVPVEVLSADVADETALSSLFLPDVRRELAGIFHCAGILDDGILLNQSCERFANVLAPKVRGGWLLHHLTQDLPLDLFVMFSSTASLFGYGGQAGYSAANAFLDALAHYRHARGLPALTVNWGSWAEAGMTSRMPADRIARMQAHGETLISVKEGMTALASLMRGDVAHAAAASINWELFARSAAHSSSLISRLVNDAKREPDRQVADFATALRHATEEEARAMLRLAVERAVGSILETSDSAAIDPTLGFKEMGIDSLGALDLRSRLQDVLGRQFPATLVFEYSCLNDLVTHLEERYFADDVRAFEAPPPRDAPCAAARPIQTPAAVADSKPGGASRSSIAIIGMSCRFPGADTPAEFWRLLAEGRDATRRIPPERWNLDEVYDADVDAPGKMYVREAALIDGIDRFDAGFFKISPREATNMDPRHRLLLEASWAALESAGINPLSLRGSDTGVYLGCDEFLNDYLLEGAGQLRSEPYIATGSTLSFAAGRLSYKLGLHGPSMVLATACSSSLVALHTAVQGLRQEECGMAIVGGAKLIFGPEETVQLCKLRALAADGRSKAFSSAADGYGRGEGCAVVVLKRLDRALADGDPVLAVIRATALNHDGPSSGLTVPNGKAQARLITKALTSAGVRPHDVDYVEAHGTGTQLGDPIEVNALTDVFGAGRTNPLYVGSVKANIGHLEEAAGLAGLIKVVLSFRNDWIPPQIHCDMLSDKIDWAHSPVTIPTRGAAWPRGQTKLAGVSSFGMSGTNAHVVLESFPEKPRTGRYATGQYIFCFSARDEEDLHACAQRFVAFLTPATSPCDIAYTLHVGRRSERHRLAVVAPDIERLKQCLELYLQGESLMPDVYVGVAARVGDEGVLTTEKGAAAAEALVWMHDWAGLAKLWCAGFDVDWTLLYAGASPRRVALPTYPFKRESLWPQTPAPTVPNPPPIANNLLSAAQDEEELNSMLVKKSSKPATDRRGEVLSALRENVADLLGMQPQEVPEEVPFDALGADSLSFMRLSQFVRDRFDIVTSFQQLIEEVSTLNELTDFLTARLGGSAITQSAQVSVSVAPVTSQHPKKVETSSSRSYRQVLTADSLSSAQQAFLSEFVKQYSTRTRRSKADAERDRPFLANCRMPPFQPHTKELSYPIVVRRSAGARFWDIDENEYVDISMGYGVHLFGHQPTFLVEALRAQLERGVHIGPQTEQAGRVARLLSELTGMPRIAFCNSGTEAVMAAIRFARAATGRTKFVMFEGSYHGWSDGTLALPAGTKNSIAMARGIGAGAMNDVVVLEYGAAESLKTIASIGNELAAVLVEPVQSRRPDLQPKAFLEDLRRLTLEAGSALIFDEVITGFRVGQGGAQAWFGIEADVVTYGKILGGGMPVGAVAGRRRFMDTIDGGPWNYGDDSAPMSPTTFFGGTFNKNPLSMAAAEAVLTHLQQQGPDLQRRVSEPVAWLAREFNAFCEQEEFPLKVVHFASLFRFIGEGEYSLQRFPLAIDLFFQMMAFKGVYILETRVCFLSASHTAEDLAFVLKTAKECLETLRKVGFFPRKEARIRSTASSLPLAATRLQDAMLGPEIAVSGGASNSGVYSNVLLSGATGFLGAYILKELMLSAATRVHCLVRAPDENAGLSRIRDNLAAYGCWQEGFAARIVAVPGDLAQSRLGLGSALWRQLAHEMDAIYHNGAFVNSLLPYDRLKAANVGGTRELLRLSVEGKIKAFHYVSSDAVFDAYGYHRQATIYENEPLAHSDTLYGGGYAETKWVADKLIETARIRGLPAFIYRPGMVTGDVERGSGRMDDFFARFVKGVIQLGLCPEIDATIDIAPADYVSQMIVRLSQQGGKGETFHLTHPEPVSYLQFVNWIRDFGYELRIVPYFEWEKALAQLRYENGNALYPLLPVFIDSAAPFLRKPKLDVTNVRRGLQNSNLVCPPIAVLLARYLRRFGELGFLPPPPTAAMLGTRTRNVRAM
ncbi:MAG: hypothetical protein C5B54_05275, partial [Acidobacteria bacterium]